MSFFLTPLPKETESSFYHHIKPFSELRGWAINFERKRKLYIQLYMFLRIKIESESNSSLIIIAETFNVI